MIHLDHVTKRLGNRLVLNDLNLTIPTGGLLVVTGVNGSGKSTLAHLVLGLIEPDSGSIEGIRRACSAVFQEDRLCEHLSAISNVRLVLQTGSREPGVADLIGRELSAAGLPVHAHTVPVGRLSGGERRRVCLVRALMLPAPILCLDEPFTGIDDTLPEVMAYTAERLAGRDTILITHSPAEAEFFNCDHLTLPGV